MTAKESIRLSTDASDESGAGPIALPGASAVCGPLAQAVALAQSRQIHLATAPLFYFGTRASETDNFRDRDRVLASMERDERFTRGD